MGKPKVAVIGSGLAGALLSQELASFADVTVFERGPACPVRPPRPIITRRPLGLFPSYAYGLGGTTGYWDAGLVAMSLEEYGSHWPVGTAAEVDRYAESVVCRLYGEKTARWWVGRQKLRVTSDLFRDEIIEPRQPFRANLSDCFREVQLKLRHEVVSISESGHGTLVRTKFLGQFQDYKFDIIIVSAGGFNSPLILKRSGLGGPTVGLNLTDHPLGFVAKITKHGDGGNFRALAADSGDLHPFEPMLKVRDSQTGLWAAFYLRPTASAEIRSDPVAESFKASEVASFRLAVMRKFIAGPEQSRKPDFKSAQTFAQRMTGPHAYVLVISEQEAVGQGSVAEDETGQILLEWSISDAVVSSIDRSLGRLANWVGGSLTRAEGDLRTRLWSAAHHSGGCRIADDPNHGVVDRNLRVHGTDRIYVCDGSVLPSTGASNTGLTIGSLALRLADHICKSVVHEPVGTSTSLSKIAISGASGHVGRIVMPALARSGFAPQPISFRKETSLPEIGGSTLLLHLANAHGSVEENMGLQKRTAEALAVAKIDQIIILQSFSTLQTPSPMPDSAAVNFGFEGVRYREPYILGKLAVEQFWTKWERERPDRRVAFLYIPTILGPQSGWTREIATHCPGRPIWVPTIPRFFSLTDEQLAASIIHLCRSGLPRGISRSMLFDRSGSLAEAVAWDRGADDVCEVSLPSVAWVVISLTRLTLVNKVLNRMLRITNRCLRSRYAILPVSALYYDIFQSQSRHASVFDDIMARELAYQRAPPALPGRQQKFEV